MALGVLSLAGGAAVLAAAGSARHVMLGYGVVMAAGAGVAVLAKPPR